MNELPERYHTHDVQGFAERALERVVQESAYFVVQRADRSDYGTDYQLEAREHASMTNARVHVQLKGTAKASNADGSVSVAVSRRNLNYLLRQPDSVYVGYHLPTQRLLACFAHDVYSRYQHDAPGWEKQAEVTVRLDVPFDGDFQSKLRNRVVVTGRSAMDRRLAQIAEPPSRVAASLGTAAPLLDTPTSRPAAVALLAALFERGADNVISTNFERFAAVLGHNSGDLINAYLAEINLGLTGYAFDESRVRAGIEAIVEVGKRGGTEPGSLLYCEGNAWLVLGDAERAISALGRGLASLKAARRDAVAAQCAKNLGSAHENAGDWVKARQYYEEALTLDPDLGEAHLALGNWHRVHGSSPEVGLRHLDAVSQRRGSGLEMSAVQGWRVPLLFELGDAVGAFREINSLIGAAPAAWVWPWCARQVATYGRTSAIAAAHSLRFWRRYMAEHPEQWFAEREFFFCCSKLHAEGEPVGITFDELRKQAERLVAHDSENAALFWDRVGHWAQREQNWEGAAEAYRKAHEIDPAAFNYCLGTALNVLGRHEEALEVLDSTLVGKESDAMFWFQVASAREGIGDSSGAAAAYTQALKLDPEYDLAWFNLGGVFWNAGQVDEAREVWKAAVRMFPEHELTLRLRTEFLREV